MVNCGVKKGAVFVVVRSHQFSAAKLCSYTAPRPRPTVKSKNSFFLLRTWKNFFPSLRWFESWSVKKYFFFSLQHIALLPNWMERTRESCQRESETISRKEATKHSTSRKQNFSSADLMCMTFKILRSCSKYSRLTHEKLRPEIRSAFAWHEVYINWRTKKTYLPQSFPLFRWEFQGRINRKKFLGSLFLSSPFSSFCAGDIPRSKTDDECWK